MVPNSFNKDKFIILDKVNLVDYTSNQRTKFLVSGTPGERPFSRRSCPEDSSCDRIWLELSKYDITEIFKHFNGIAGANFNIPLASRGGAGNTDTLNVALANLFDVSGGSRINYRVHPSWGGKGIGNVSANTYAYSSLEFNN